MDKPIRVALIEDDPKISQLLQLIIDGSPGLSCQHVYNSCEQAIRLLRLGQNDLLLLDIDLPEMSGIEGIQHLKKIDPDLNIIMLTVHEEGELVFKALCEGAVGYLVKGLPPDQLLISLKEAYHGGAPMSPSIARKVVHFFHREQNSPLSDREREVLQLLCNGENYKTIAQQLFISTNTVKAHIKNIYTKLEVNNRAEAVAKAIKKKMI